MERSWKTTGLFEWGYRITNTKIKIRIQGGFTKADIFFFLTNYTQNIWDNNEKPHKFTNKLIHFKIALSSIKMYLFTQYASFIIIKKWK